MGYEIRVRGEIKIEPLPTIEQLAELSREGFDGGSMSRSTRSIKYKVATSTTVESPHRTVTDIIDVSLVTAVEDSFSAYGVDEDLAKIADLLGEGYTYSGALRGYGDFYIQWSLDGRTVVTEYAKLIWPDGTTEEIDL